MARFSCLAIVSASLALSFAAATPVLAQGTLRIAMTAGDLPVTAGAPTQGLEGTRFAGYPVFEPLVMWDLRKVDGPVGTIPWLATEWKVDEVDRNKWIFSLRRGVKFHDGSEFDADVVMFNFERYFNKDSPQFYPQGAVSQASRAPFLAKWQKVDAYTVAIYTKTPTRYLTDLLANVLMVSPSQYEKVGRDWQKYAAQPSGTGAFRFTSIERTSLTMEKNPDYWNKERAAKLDKVVLFAMPEATTRLAALRSGQVDWIEVPPPDAFEGLTKAGFQVMTSRFPQVWPYWIQTAAPSIFSNVKLRQALNYAMDREGLVELLNGSAEPAYGYWKKDDPRFGNPKNVFSFDPAKAKALIAESGWKGGLVPAKILTSTAGSGQMLPLPMNELLQQSARDAGFDLSFSVVDFAQMSALRLRPDAPEMKDIVGSNSSYTTGDMTFFYFSFFPPNWPNYNNPEVTKILTEWKENFDVKDPDALMAKAHEQIVDDSPWIWIVHDRNPRAFSAKVKGYTPAQSWFNDLTTVYMAP